MTTDTRKPYPLCTRCEHPWHGLPCAVATTNHALGLRAPSGPCGCPSPYDDQYWEEAT